MKSKHTDTPQTPLAKPSKIRLEQPARWDILYFATKANNIKPTTR
jgi:hypothetical protein